MVEKCYSGFLGDTIVELRAFIEGILYTSPRGKYIDAKAFTSAMYPTFDKFDNRMKWKLDKKVVDEIIEMIAIEEEE